MCFAFEPSDVDQHDERWRLLSNLQGRQNAGFLGWDEATNEEKMSYVSKGERYVLQERTADWTRALHSSNLVKHRTTHQHKRNNTHKLVLLLTSTKCRSQEMDVNSKRALLWSQAKTHQAKNS
jgi:hypothetical protein